MLISAAISVANCGDHNGSHVLLYYCKRAGYFPKKVFADQGYERKDFKAEIDEYGVDLEIVKRREKKGFAVQAKRW